MFGAKLTGSLGRFAFGTLSALDQAPGREVEPDHPDFGKDRLFNILRGQYSLGPSNYLGALVVDSEFAGGFNRVLGTDLSWRVNDTQRVSGFLLGSATRQPRAENTTTGIGAQAGYEYSTRKLVLVGYGEHYDRDFEMQTAFINRVGITGGWGFAEYSFYPDKKYPWLLRISPFSFTQGGEDRNAGGNELLQVTGVRVSFTRQGFLRVDRFDGFETWAGQRFDRGNWRTQGGVQLYRWLSLNGQHFTGAAVFYDPTDPFQGEVRDGRLDVTLQPSGRFTQSLNLPPRLVRPGVHRRAGLRSGHHQQPDDLSVHAAVLRAGHRAVRQLPLPRAHRLSRFVQAPARHRRLHRLRVAPGAPGFRGWRVDARRGRLSDEPAGVVLQSVVSAPLLRIQNPESRI